MRWRLTNKNDINRMNRLAIQSKVVNNFAVTLLVLVFMLSAVDIDGASMVLTDEELAEVPLKVKLDIVADADVALKSEKKTFFLSSLCRHLVSRT